VHDAKGNLIGQGLQSWSAFPQSANHQIFPDFLRWCLQQVLVVPVGGKLV